MKKAVSLILALFIISASLSFAVSAAGTSISNAYTISLGKTYSGVIADSDINDYYKFSLSDSGEILIDYSTPMPSSKIVIYEEDGTEVEKYYPEKNKNSDTMNWSRYVNLVSGVYYIMVDGYGYTGSYNVKVSFFSANESFHENQNTKHNSFEKSNMINLNEKYNGQIAENDDVDYYKFTLPTSGRISINYSTPMPSAKIVIYEEDGTEIEKYYPEKNKNSDNMNWSRYIDLVSGTYYLMTDGYGYTGSYSIKASFSSANETFYEDQYSKDNSLERSNTINLNTKYNGHIAENDDEDYYNLYIRSSAEVSIKLNTSMNSAKIVIYDEDGTEFKKYYPEKNKNSDTINWTKEVVLSSGTYFIMISGYGYTGAYDFIISKSSTNTTQAPTTRPADRPTTTRPAEVPTTRNNTEKPTQAPTKAPEYIEPETYVEPEIDSDIDVDIDIYVYINFEYTIVNNYIIILNYFGEDSYVVVPEEIDGYEVKGIGDDAFTGTSAEEVEIPDCVTQFGSNAFGEESGQDIQLYCSEGSAAQNYADEKGIAYQLHMEDYADEGFSYDVNNGDDYVEDDAEYEDDSGTSYGSGGITGRTILIIAVVAVVAIGAIIAVIVIGKKKSII